MSVLRSVLARMACDRIVTALLGLALFASTPVVAQTNIDNTCASCDRRLLDSLNYHDIKSIRVNQVGYRT